MADLDVLDREALLLRAGGHLKPVARTRSGPAADAGATPGRAPSADRAGPARARGRGRGVRGRRGAADGRATGGGQAPATASSSAKRGSFTRRRPVGAPRPRSGA